jgi:hypothetical protein
MEFGIFYGVFVNTILKNTERFVFTIEILI